MRVLIVDDEPPARSRLIGLLEESGIAEPVGEAGNGEEALRLSEEQQPDIVLLDIRLPGMDGLEVARHLGTLASPPAVIFTTAYDSHALAAFEANAIGYLLKPIRADRLTDALQRAARPTRAQLSGLGQTDAVPGARTHISATLSGKLRLVPIAEVRYFRAEHKYVTVGYAGGELLIEDSLSSLEREFADRFLRVHRNALVSLAHVQGLAKDKSGRNVIRLAGIGVDIEVSRRMSASVRRVLRAGMLTS